MKIKFKSTIKELATGNLIEVKLFLQQTILFGQDAFIASIRTDKNDAMNSNKDEFIAAIRDDNFAKYCIGVESSSIKKSITKLNRALEKQGYRLN
jgi:hypothetical protein